MDAAKYDRDEWGDTAPSNSKPRHKNKHRQGRNAKRQHEKDAE